MNQNLEKKRRLSAQAKKSLREIAEADPDELWDYKAKRRGTWITEDDVDRMGVDHLIEMFAEDVIKRESRRESLEGGYDDPTPSELKRLRSAYVDMALRGDGDADFVPGYALADVTDEKDRQGVALVVRTGYSFSGLNTSLAGIFPSDDRARRHMEKLGWCTWR